MLCLGKTLRVPELIRYRIGLRRTIGQRCLALVLLKPLNFHLRASPRVPDDCGSVILAVDMAGRRVRLDPGLFQPQRLA